MVWLDILIFVGQVLGFLAAVTLLIMYLIMERKEKLTLRSVMERYDLGCLYIHHDYVVGTIPFKCSNYDKFPKCKDCQRCLKRKEDGEIKNAEVEDRITYNPPNRR